MTFRIANGAGRSAFVDSAGCWFDGSRVSGGNVSADPMKAWLQLDELHQAASATPDAVPDGRLTEAVVQAPIPSPRSVFAVGLNYRGHADEAKMEPPGAPLFFAKFPSCLTGPSSRSSSGETPTTTKRSWDDRVGWPARLAEEEVVTLHRLASITIGVPNVDETCRYYAEFGLLRDAARFSTSDGGEQLRIVKSPSRRLIELCIGADDPDDLDRISERLARLGIASQHEPGGVSAVDVASGARAVVKVLPRISPDPAAVGGDPGAGRAREGNHRAPSILREEPVRPRKLGHVVIGTPDAKASQRFFAEGVGFKVSDQVRGTAAFMRCSTDHHNLLLQASPVAFLHHTSWQVDDVDEVGRGATRMLEGHSERHVWGLGRHYIGSNFFWYLRDPAGNFSEYYSDMDTITDAQLWTPGTWEPSLHALYAWGPDVPPSMLTPDDLADLMTTSHQS